MPRRARISLWLAELQGASENYSAEIQTKITQETWPDYSDVT